MTTNELTSPEAVEKLAAQYDDVGLRDDELVTATLRALSAENKRLREAALKACSWTTGHRSIAPAPPLPPHPTRSPTRMSAAIATVLMWR